MSAAIRLDGRSLTRQPVARCASVELAAVVVAGRGARGRFRRAGAARGADYGVNTGFGSNADKLLGAHRLREQLPGSTSEAQMLPEELQRT